MRKRFCFLLLAAAAILLSELCWQLAGCDKLRGMYSSLADRILSADKKGRPC